MQRKVHRGFRAVQNTQPLDCFSFTDPLFHQREIDNERQTDRVGKKKNTSLMQSLITSQSP